MIKLTTLDFAEYIYNKDSLLRDEWVFLFKIIPLRMRWTTKNLAQHLYDKGMVFDCVYRIDKKIVSAMCHRKPTQHEVERACGLRD